MQQTVINHRYVTSRLLGCGGMGEVYLARDKILGREVAIKVLRKRYAEDEEFVARFRREARSAAALSHPSVVSVHDLGCSGDGAHYIAMEYVPGGTLKQRLAEGGALGPNAAAAVALQIADALDAAHARGIVHRDVKPQNVLLTTRGDAKLADFGIAGAASLDMGSPMTSVVGTPSYMSPEQASGEPVGPASDLYSLGVVLHEMLTGSVPFEGETPVAVSMKRVNEPPPSLRQLNPRIPEGMDSLIAKLLARRPADRYAHAAELARDLRRLRDGLPPFAANPEADPSGEGRVAGSPDIAVYARGPGRGLRGAGNGKKRLGGPILGASLAVALFAALVLFGVAGWAIPRGTGGLRSDGSPQHGSGRAPAATSPAALDAAAASRAKKNADPGTDGDASNVQLGGSVFVHRATPENVSANSTYVDDPSTNGNPDAVLTVTQNWNPKGAAGTYDAHPIGVWYDAGVRKWAIFNEDRAAMPEGASFNVVVLRDPAEAEQASR
jgi:tRNA A-37 threonylcarbamoyl transferase component Bud32